MATTTSMSSEISDAFSKGARGCPLCSLWTLQEASLTETIKRNDLSSDPKLKEKLELSSGFCNRHTHAIHKATTASNVQVGLGSPESARTVIKKFEDGLAPLLASLKAGKAQAVPGKEAEEDPLTATISALEKTISGGAACPVCEKLLESDKARAVSLIQMLESKDFAEQYAKSDAVCMPHFVTLMRLLPGSSKAPEATWRLLAKTELARLASVDNLLNERMKKYSWDYRDEGITPEEAGAQKTGMLAIVGAEGLFERQRKTSLRPAK
jgi:Family of unknown function (DUF6062)